MDTNEKNLRQTYVCVCVPAFCMNFGKNVKQFQFKYKTHGNDNLA